MDEHRYDLVVLSQGVIPAWHADGVVDIEEAADGFVHTPEVKLNPSFTTLPGVFVGGVAAGPKDIPDAIVEAGEAAMAAANHLKRNRWRAERGRRGARPHERPGEPAPTAEAEAPDRASCASAAAASRPS